MSTGKIYTFLSLNTNEITFLTLFAKLLVKESWIGQAMLHMMEHERYVVEGAAACPLAAIIGQLVPELKNKKYLLMIILISI